MARAKKKSKRGANCKVITFKKRGGRKLSKANWVTVTRCASRKLRGHNKKQCRVGGKGPRAHLFAPCTPQRRAAAKRRR